MVARRQPLLWTFVGGCLSGAALIGFWPKAEPTFREHAPEARANEPDRAAALAAPPDDDRDVADDDPTVASTAAVGPPRPAPVADAPQAEPGSSVADILIRLEVAYRQGAGASPQSTTTITTLAQTSPREVLANEETGVVAAAPSPKQVPPAGAPPAVAPKADEQSHLASRDDARQGDIYQGDVDQSINVETTNVGTVHQGDVVVVQNVVQYLPFFALPSSVRNARPTPAPRPVPGRPNPLVPFRSTRDNPDNRSPFTYPVELVH